MANKAPLYFKEKLGGLFPANATAENAMTYVKGTVSVDIKGGIANQRRRGLFWVVASIVTGLLNDKHNMTLTEDDLHEIMREKFGMYDAQTLPSGEVHKRYWSTSDRAMNEADRAEYLNKCLAVWAKWTGVDVTTLQREAARQD